MTEPSALRPGTAAQDRRDALVHRALLYGSRDEFLRTAVPFLRAGRQAGDAVVAVVAPPVAGALRERLDAETTEAVEFIDPAEWFAGPMHALAYFHDRARGDWWPRGRLRLLAEPVWDGRRPLETREWKRYDALLNVVFAATPTLIVCAYDTAALPGHVLDDAARTHPELTGPDGTAAAARFTDPAGFCAECDAGPLPPPPAAAARRPFASGGLPGLRSFLSAEAARLGLPRERTLPFVLAANEVATGIVRDAGGRGAVWVWAEGGELICDVADPVGVPTDRFLGYVPPGARGHDPAMWAVRRLCHIVEVRSDGQGLQIRLRVKLH
ncbi:sensor histidine kinase [Actinomadura sp. 7K507]|uniref:sensor histidine kinase n=1 Tax=Actinomadura sp. 7K507 TaxID=2530365 RepID=UPI00104DF65B|nr:sensor histidine kinase [Actinomadura sp. 7K507]TDC94316.1 sensor histidine kinase [Actinomadura sp. 7K507]